MNYGTKTARLEELNHNDLFPSYLSCLSTNCKWPRQELQHFLTDLFFPSVTYAFCDSFAT